MRYDDVWVAGHGSWFPPATPIGEAIERGLIDAAAARRSGITSVCEAAPGEEQSPPAMAARAGSTALSSSGHTPSEVDLLLHATVYYQGHDLWAPASYVQRRALGNTCPAIEIKQMSNGGMAALELGAAYLTGGHGRVAAMLTSADRFVYPGFDRWNSDPGTVYGDGGTSVVLSTRGGFARLRSICTYADPGLEQMHRGQDSFGDRAFSVRCRVDLESAKKDFIPEIGLSASIARVNTGFSTVVKQALADADCDLADIDRFVLPHLGRRRLEVGFLRPLGMDVERTSWPHGSTIGHLGSGDQFAGIGHLAEVSAPGERVLVLGSGGGFSWSAAVLEMTNVTDERRAR